MVGFGREGEGRRGRGGGSDEQGKNELGRVVESDRDAGVDACFGAGVAVCGGRVGECGHCGISVWAFKFKGSLISEEVVGCTYVRR